MSSLLFGNGTDIVHWKPSSNTRGTFDILCTCTITMLLCVWSAVHLNVPPPGSVWEPRLRKVGWLVLALLAPEMVAFTAWTQRRKAYAVMSYVNKAYNLSNPSPWYETAVKGIEKVVLGFVGFFMSLKQKPSRQPTLEAQKPEGRRSWTMMHGFYVGMGGLAIHISESLPESQKFFPLNTSETVFIGRDALEYLIEKEPELLDLSEIEIKSKSKANGLAKALVCIQALWFIAQCLTRLAERIPISLLELNTFGHAVCALMIYLLWWEKPFGVDYPTIIQSRSLLELRALHYMNCKTDVARLACHRITTRLESNEDFRNDPIPFDEMWIPEISLITCKNYSVYGFRGLELDDPLSKNICDKFEQRSEHDGNNKDSSITLGPGQTLPGTGWRIRHPRELDFLRDIFAPWVEESLRGHKEVPKNDREDHDHEERPRDYPSLPTIQLTTRDVTRWKMAWRSVDAFQQAGGQREVVGPPFIMWRSFTWRCGDWPDVYEFDGLPMLLSFSAAGLIYGGLHALAWFAHFDSPTERWLWRVSACVVMGGLPVIYVVWRRSFATSLERYIYIVEYFFLRLATLIYFLARGYLVVECFINLFNLPAGVYDVPSWPAYFPHIS